jgi:hypothetical protein
MYSYSKYVGKMLRYIIWTERTIKSTETLQILTDEQVEEERPHIDINDQSVMNGKSFANLGY